MSTINHERGPRPPRARRRHRRVPARVDLERTSSASPLAHGFLAGLRIVFRFTFFWAFIDKMFFSLG